MMALELTGWKHVSSGKVRDIYAPASLDHVDRVAQPVESAQTDSTAAGQQTSSQSGQGEGLLMVTSDRISAYDYVLPSLIPDKGKVLNQMALWWMQQFTDIVPNHVISTQVPDAVAGRAVICTALQMIPIECVVRGYLTGSGLVEYQQSGTVCGIALPEGLEEASKLPEPIFTPAAKAELGEHDENISFERTVALVGAEQAEIIRDLSIRLYTQAARIAAEKGVIIADTKFEFGVDPRSGAVILADEVLTPDSSRFWPADQWHPGQVTPSFDKQYVRDWLTSPASGWEKNGSQEPPQLPSEVVEATRARYIEAFTVLTGQEPTL